MLRTRGHLTTSEISTLNCRQKKSPSKGQRILINFFAISKTGNEAELFMSKLGLVCSMQDKKNSPNMVKFYSTKKDLAKIVRCKHSFGLVFGQNIWVVEYFLNSKNSVIDGGSLIICPACQGV